MEISSICSWTSDLASLGSGLTNDTTAELRFAVGDRVKCRTDENEWSIGTVVSVHYHQPGWPEEVVIPYQVEIDDGLLVYVPRDADELCRRIERAWWETALHRHAPPEKNMYDAPGQYLVVLNTMVKDQCNPRNAVKIADASPPATFDIVEIQVCEDRIRGRVAEPAGWISLRSTDNEKVFAVPAKSAFAARFRYVNQRLFLDDTDTDDDNDTKCSSYDCQLNAMSDHQSLCLDTLLTCSVGQDINERDEHAQTALMISVKAESLPALQKLLALGADANLGDKHGDTALHHAVRLGKEEFVQALLQSRADPNVQSLNPDLNKEYKSKTFSTAALHQTPLHLAAKSGSLSLVRALLLANADPNIRDAECKVPLHVALESDADSEEVVDVLIENGADVNLGNMRIGMQTTLLHDAAYQNDAGLVQKLLAAKAEMNLLDKHGMTALHIAIRSRREGIARLLIEAGCDRSIALPGTGATAVNLAERNGMQNLILLLRTEMPEGTS